MITLELRPDTLKLLKLSLQKKIPEVKSSHRAEALARGLGFRTHATLLKEMSNGHRIEVRTNGLPFNSYLAKHGEFVDPTALYLSASKVAIALVAENYPRLSSHGFGVGRPFPGEGSWREGMRKARERFEENRQELSSFLFAEAFLRALVFVEHVPKTKTIRPRTNSYWLKHLAENYRSEYPEGQKLGPAYVPNGAFIAAAIHAGFDCSYGFDPDGYEHPNATFNMPHKPLMALDCEIRPDGARAQARRAKIRNAELRKRSVWVG